ncbi:hypothetical protein [Acidiphilium acidophilum]|jgi:hypothetical protein|uniref:Uncharacterized protein n=1 Tax=Acidiphilium acidophilum TaxID=76588 RepID=A0AAW9DY21_ACIAO|nr:hypothetical protein [Acidiphilium acidophilum]MDX5933005.1 hypothetical protein [Acidiphilium acidophilum]
MDNQHQIAAALLACETARRCYRNPTDEFAEPKLSPEEDHQRYLMNLYRANLRDMADDVPAHENLAAGTNHAS